MSKRLIIRQQVIDCGEEECGKCANLLRWDRYCIFWRTGVALGKSNRPKRCYQCKNAEKKT